MISSKATVTATVRNAQLLTKVNKIYVPLLPFFPFVKVTLGDTEARTDLDSDQVNTFYFDVSQEEDVKFDIYFRPDYSDGSIVGEVSYSIQDLITSGKFREKVDLIYDGYPVARLNLSINTVSTNM